jgi:putative hydrolases of HD superfamily
VRHVARALLEMYRNFDPQARGLLPLARIAGKLKRVPRTGWLDRGIPPLEVESVADHSLGVALLAWACAVERQAQGADLDPARVALLALLHDLPEAETGDEPPYDPTALSSRTDPAERRQFLDRRHIRDEKFASAKRAREDSAMSELLAALPLAAQVEMESLWEELRHGISAEAKFVKQVDRLETFIQSRLYLDRVPGAPMDSFRREVLDTIDDPILAAIRDAALGDES